MVNLIIITIDYSRKGDQLLSVKTIIKQMRQLDAYRQTRGCS